MVVSGSTMASASSLLAIVGFLAKKASSREVDTALVFLLPEEQLFLAVAAAEIVIELLEELVTNPSSPR